MRSRRFRSRSSSRRRPAPPRRAEKQLQRVALRVLLEALACAANEAASPEGAMRTCLERISGYANCTFGRVAILKAGPGVPVVESSLWLGRDPQRFSEFMRVSESFDYSRLSGKFISVVLREKRPVWIEEFGKMDPPGRLRDAIKAGLQSGFAFPVIVQGEVAAFLEFFAEEPRRADPLLLEAIGSVGAQLARLIERGRAEAAHARLATIVEGSDDAIVSGDLGRNTLSWNAAAERLFGYSAAEIVGRNISLIIPPDQEAQAAQNRALVAAGQSIPAYDAVRLTKDGRRIDVSITQSAIKDARGEMIGVSLIFRDITERKQAEEKIRRLAHHDALTGLPNRTLFYDRLRQAIRLARRERHELALLYLDLDGFKAVNDTLGHDAGDELLRSVAQRIRARLRETDTTARIGGDEFTVILPKTTARQDAAVVAKKLLETVSAPYHLGSAQREAVIRASIGIAIYPRSAEEMEALVRAADAAMYEAKRARSDFRFCDGP